MTLFSVGEEEARQQLRVVGSMLEGFGIGFRDITEEGWQREQGQLEQRQQ